MKTLGGPTAHFLNRGYKVPHADHCVSRTEGLWVGRACISFSSWMLPAVHERKGPALLGLQQESLYLDLRLWEGKDCKSLLTVGTRHHTQRQLALVGGPGG